MGRALCRLLCEAGAEVHGTWRSRPTDASVLAHHAVFPADAHELIQQIRPERVFHLASPIDHDTDPSVYRRLLPGILEASMAIAQACEIFHARLIHIGTCAEYGDLPSPLHESNLCRPTAPYGMLKLAATHAVLSMVRSTTLHAVVLRPFRAHGPHDRTSLVAQACHAAAHGLPLSITSDKSGNGMAFEIAEAIMAAGAILTCLENYSISAGVPRPVCVQWWKRFSTSWNGYISSSRRIGIEERGSSCTME